MKISPARSAAFEVLCQIESNGAFSSSLLAELSPELSQLDRSLCHEIVMGCLRLQIHLDRLIAVVTSGKRLDAEVRIALRMGVFQLKWLDRIPAYSAINESVNLVQKAKKSSAKGFVNAVLRAISREQIKIGFIDEIDQLSVETSHPRWLVERWILEFGIDETRAICENNQKMPPLAFRTLLPTRNDLAAMLPGLKSSSNVKGCYIADPSTREQMFRLARENSVYIQDEASQMAASCFDLPEGGNFIDICASPGGKTGLAASRFASEANLIVAGDFPDRRVESLRDNLQWQGIVNVSIVQYDAERQLPFADGCFDRVLVDAPCSGTGTIRRNPEIRYRLFLDDLERNAKKQLKILDNASKLVRAGGEIIYSTCSLEREENEEVCNKFLVGSDNFYAVPPNVTAKFITKDGFARTRPAFDDMDGFFIACFRRFNV